MNIIIHAIHAQTPGDRYKMNTLCSSCQTTIGLPLMKLEHKRTIIPGPSAAPPSRRQLPWATLEIPLSDMLFPGLLSPRRVTCSPTAYLTVGQCLTLHIFIQMISQTTVYSTSEDSPTLLNNVNLDLDSLTEWFRSNTNCP